MKKLSAILCFVLLSFSAHEGFAQVPSPTPSTNQDNPAEKNAVLKKLPDLVVNTEFRLLGGKTVRLSEHSGKAMVINLFATWCGPCRLESPALAKLHREFHDQGLVVIELSTEDPQISKDSVRDWVRRFHLPYSVGWTTRDIALTLMQDRASIPQSFVIARDGRIVRRFIGYNTSTTLNSMREAVEEALK